MKNGGKTGRRSVALGLLAVALLLVLPACPVWAANKTVIFMNGDDVYKKHKVQKNTYLLAEALPDTGLYTFLGWGGEAGQTTNPAVEAHQYFKVDQNYTLYAVYYPGNEEPNISASKLTALDKKKYKELILVGDSRMARTKSAITAKVASSKGLVFFAVSGRALSGFTGSGSYNESALLARVQKKNGKKPIAIVFNLGVNDLRAGASEKSVSKKYLEYLKTLSSKLKKYNVKLFYMSVGPVSGTATRGRSGSSIRLFNKYMKEGCQKAGWNFIDSYSWMMQNGFSSSSIFDSLHYGSRTSKRVLDMVVKTVNAF